jgi:hypothetical protein
MGLCDYEGRFRKKKQIDPRLIIWAWAAIEADFLRHYRIDLLDDGFTDNLSWRRFLLLVRNLPRDSAYYNWLTNKSNRSMAEWSDEAIEREIKYSKVK